MFNACTPRSVVCPMNINGGVKLLRTGVRYKMHMWIQHFQFARTARVKLDGIFSKKVCLREEVPQGCALSPALFLVYANVTLATISKRVSNSLHADDLATWNASVHTTTATYRIQEAINSIFFVVVVVH